MRDMPTRSTEAERDTPWQRSALRLGDNTAMVMRADRLDGLL
jgi:hypothetical protein